ncbi:unnamed protein product [Parajaminaea phylloscopi]
MLRSMYKGGLGQTAQQSNSRASSYEDSMLSSSSSSSERRDPLVSEEAEEDGLGPLPGSSPSASTRTAQSPLTARKRIGSDQGDVLKSRLDRFEPVSAEDCFEDALEVEIEGEGTWRVYVTHPRPPRREPARQEAQRAQHGISLAATTKDAALAAIELPEVDEDADDDDADADDARGQADLAGHPRQDPGTLIFFHHGAGFSGLSFALAAKEITRLTQGQVGVMALDCRGHGRTTHPSSISLPLNMSPDRLSQDCVAILTKLYPDASRMPSLLLAGHSMGGSVVVSLSRALQSLHPTPARVAGVVVMDVVEGTATEALGGMKRIVENLPKGFSSISEAIRWHVESGQIHNVESARRSVPSLLVPNESCPAGEVASAQADEDAIEELAETGRQDEPTEPDTTSKQWPLVWRHDLLSTAPYWPLWFKGLSSAFLAVKAARLLILAGTDRLDRDLMVGQMQGKYQLHVLQDVGHCLHEDAPERTANLLVDFWRRNEVIPAKLAGMGVGLRKVGQ